MRLISTHVEAMTPNREIAMNSMGWPNRERQYRRLRGIWDTGMHYDPKGIAILSPPVEEACSMVVGGFNVPCLHRAA